MDSSFSANFGSLLTLNVRIKCGFKPCLCQIRRTLFSLMPLAFAMVRVLQWVALSGFPCVVFRTTSSILLAVIVGYVAAAGALPGYVSRPAAAGDIIELYATGCGPTN